MDLKKLFEKIEKYIDRDLKLTKRTYKNLEKLGKDVVELEKLVSHSGSDTAVLIDHYRRHAQKLEKYSERIVKKLDVLIRRLERLISEVENLDSRDKRYFQLWINKLDMCRQNVIRILSKNGELHQLINEEFPNWEKIEAKIKEAIGDNRSPGLRTLINLFEQLEKNDDLIKGKKGEDRFLQANEFPALINLTKMLGINEIMTVKHPEQVLFEKDYFRIFRPRNEEDIFAICIFSVWMKKVKDDTRYHGKRKTSPAQREISWLERWSAGEIELAKDTRDDRERMRRLTNREMENFEPTQYSIYELGRGPYGHLSYYLMKYSLLGSYNKFFRFVVPLMFVDNHFNKYQELLVELIKKHGGNPFHNLSAVEVGSNGKTRKTIPLISLFREYRDQSGSSYQRVNEEDLVMLSNYRHFFPHKYNLTFSCRVFDRGSGMHNKKVSEGVLMAELLSVFANITVKGGFSIHLGEPIPGFLKNPSLLQFIGFELVEEVRDPTVIILQKVSDEEITTEELHRWLDKSGEIGRTIQEF